MGSIWNTVGGDGGDDGGESEERENVGLRRESRRKRTKFSDMLKIIGPARQKLFRTAKKFDLLGLKERERYDTVREL